MKNRCRLRYEKVNASPHTGANLCHSHCSIKYSSSFRVLVERVLASVSGKKEFYLLINFLLKCCITFCSSSWCTVDASFFLMYSYKLKFLMIHDLNHL